MLAVSGLVCGAPRQPCRHSRSSTLQCCASPASSGGEPLSTVTPLSTRRDTLALALSVSVAVAAASPAAAIDLGLRRSGNGAAKFSPPEDAYTQLPSGVRIYDVVTGSGAVAKPGQRVVLHYDAKWKRLTVSSSRVGMGVTGGTPYGFDLGTPAGTPGGPFLPGINIAVEGMRVGGQRKAIIPPELAYGSRQVQEIPPNASLNFDLELLSIKAVRKKIKIAKWI